MKYYDQSLYREVTGYMMNYGLLLICHQDSISRYLGMSIRCAIWLTTSGSEIKRKQIRMFKSISRFLVCINQHKSANNRRIK